MAEADPITIFRKDTTIRWSCRAGDFVLWFGNDGLMGVLSAPADSWKVHDLWEMRDGDFVTITNRTEDLPQWFELHPCEACNRLGHWMMEKLRAGYQPREIMNAANIWRPKAGDRLAWVGGSRPCVEGRDDILNILDFRECALAFGSSSHEGIEHFAQFGGLSEAGQSPQQMARCQAAAEMVREMGIPRTVSEKWRLG